MENTDLVDNILLKQCWVCQSINLKLVKKSNVKGTLIGRSFAITDSNYGTTLALYQCQDCNFIQFDDSIDVLHYYQEFEDASYDAGHKSRSMQFQKILKTIHCYISKGRLLDIGAGNGLLVQRALQMGYFAEGIEPSQWLQQKAENEYNLPVYFGTFPNPKCLGPYDIITLIDVIEHVSQPLTLLKEIRKAITPNGILVLNTPDVDSLMARILKWKWWHFRVAHIGYFNKKNIALALEKSGFDIVKIHYPKWYFSGDYLFERIMKYLPKYLQRSAPRLLKNIILPLNLRDSIMLICKVKETSK